MKSATRSNMTITQSSTAAFLRCQEYYKLAYIELLKKDTEPHYLWFGSLFHDVLATMYAGGDMDGFFIEKSREVSENSSKMQEAEGAEYFDEKSQMLIDMEKIYNRYARYYWTDNGNWKILEIETPIETELFGYPILAKPDMIIEESGNKWIVEHKTTASISISYLRKIAHDFQSMFYLLLVPDAVGVIYNVVSKAPQPAVEPLKKGGLSKDARKRYNHVEYEAKVKELGLDMEDYQEHIDYLKTQQGNFFFRQRVTYSERQLERFKLELKSIFADMRILELYTESNYRNITSCYLHNSECRFFPICSSPYPEEAKKLYVKKLAKHEEYVK